MNPWAERFAAWSDSTRAWWQRTVDGWTAWVMADPAAAQERAAAVNANLWRWHDALSELHAAIPGLPAAEQEAAWAEYRRSADAFDKYRVGFYSQTEGVGVAPLLIVGVGLVAIAGVAFACASAEGIAGHLASTIQYRDYVQAHQAAAPGVAPLAPAAALPERKNIAEALADTAESGADAASSTAWAAGGLAALAAVGALFYFRSQR